VATLEKRGLAAATGWRPTSRRRPDRGEAVEGRPGRPTAGAISASRCAARGWSPARLARRALLVGEATLYGQCRSGECADTFREMQFVGIIVGLIVVTAAITLVLPSRWSWLPVALAVALPVVVVLAGQSTEDDSPESLAIAYAVVFSAPIMCGTAVGSGIKWALQSRR
jgi:predicted MFS family arabinose efflux permease